MVKEKVKNVPHKANLKKSKGQMNPKNQPRLCQEV